MFATIGHSLTSVSTAFWSAMQSFNDLADVLTTRGGSRRGTLCRLEDWVSVQSQRPTAQRVSPRLPGQRVAHGGHQDYG